MCANKLRVGGSLRLGPSTLRNAPESLVGADENVAVGDGKRAVVRLTEGIGGQPLKLRMRIEHERIAGMVDDIEPAIGQNHGRPG